MLKIAICDDERNVVEKIKCDIFSYPEKCEIDGFYSGEELLLSQKNYDIIFLDIDMKGMNGIEVAKQLREEDKNVKIIYVYKLYRLCKLCIFSACVCISSETGKNRRYPQTA